MLHFISRNQTCNKIWPIPFKNRKLCIISTLYLPRIIENIYNIWRGPPLIFKKILPHSALPKMHCEWVTVRGDTIWTRCIYKLGVKRSTTLSDFWLPRLLINAVLTTHTFPSFFGLPLSLFSLVSISLPSLAACLIPSFEHVHTI